MSLRRIYQFFFCRFLSKLLLYWNIKKKRSPDYFSYKSFREFSNSNARSRTSKNPDSVRSTNAHDLLRLPLTIACARTSSCCIRSQTFTNVYCSESHSAAVKDSPPGSPWKIYFQPLTILAIFLLKNNRRKFEMDYIPWKTRVGWRFDRNVCLEIMSLLIGKVLCLRFFRSSLLILRCWFLRSV